jgi:glycosyltransferase involved in cell wall biosynthesis
MTGTTVALVSDSAGFGGSELCLSTVVSLLRDRWRFVAFLPDDAAEQTRTLLADAGAELHAIAGLRRIPRLRPLRTLRGALADLAPDLVHVSLTDQGDGLVPLLAARSRSRASLATLNLVIPGRRAWRERVSARALRVPDLVVCVSESVAAYARSAGARTKVVPNGVREPELRADARAALGIEGSGLVIGGIGRLDRQKGWDILCRAAALLARELADASFVVLGEGPERESLEALPGSERVRFLGHRECAASYLSAFDLLVVPSRYEAFGLVALEAMLAGVPVIASDVGGLPEVLGECGVLVESERPDLLAAAIARLARDAGLRSTYARCAARRARARYSIEAMAAGTEEAYRWLLEHGKAGSRS